MPKSKRKKPEDTVEVLKGFLHRREIKIREIRLTEIKSYDIDPDYFGEAGEEEVELPVLFVEYRNKPLLVAVPVGLRKKLFGNYPLDIYLWQLGGFRKSGLDMHQNLERWEAICVRIYSDELSLVVTPEFLLQRLRGN